jgi:hypothetical protein
LNYKETLYFVATCLTISLEAKNKQVIEKRLQSETIDWDAVVKLSTSHYVLPALYVNLQRANLLHYLPKELVAYMAHLTQLNSERNEQIITQAKALNTLLLANNISPIFLKGTGNLLAGLYEDIAERMVGDIDFIFSTKDYPKAIELVRNFGYSEVNVSDYYLPGGKHYRRLQKEHNIAAVEIHSELLGIEKYRKEFNYGYVAKDSQAINGVRVLSDTNKLNLSIIANQINDYGYYHKTMALRNAYDVFVLSKKTSAKDAVNTLNKLSHPLNCFLAACYEVFNSVDSLAYHNTKKTVIYTSDFKKQFTNPKAAQRRRKCITIYFFIATRVNILYKAIFYREYRIWLYKRLTGKHWYKEKLVQLGIKE